MPSSTKNFNVSVGNQEVPGDSPESALLTVNVYQADGTTFVQGQNYPLATQAVPLTLPDGTYVIKSFAIAMPSGQIVGDVKTVTATFLAPVTRTVVTGISAA